MKLVLIVVLAGGIAAMGIVPPWIALGVMGFASVVTMFSEVGQAKRAKAPHVRGWWLGYLAGAIVLTVVFVPVWTAYGYASTQLEQVNYGIIGGGLLTMLFIAVVVAVMRFPRWLSNLLVIGAALAALWAWGQL
ncbi:MAG: hypothetical protein KF893_25595 [Caldilineaceae bacterium]|nr:hypothetical protein [Caldilineaceae bacterium]